MIFFNEIGEFGFLRECSDTWIVREGVFIDDFQHTRRYLIFQPWSNLMNWLKKRKYLEFEEFLIKAVFDFLVNYSQSRPISSLMSWISSQGELGNDQQNNESAYFQQKKICSLIKKYIFIWIKYDFFC